MEDKFVLGGKEFKSRFILGSGRSISSMSTWIMALVASPLLLPMGAANGITAAAPAF